MDILIPPRVALKMIKELDPTNLCLATQIICLGGIVTDIWLFINVAAILDISISPRVPRVHPSNPDSGCHGDVKTIKKHWVDPTLWLSPLATRLIFDARIWGDSCYPTLNVKYRENAVWPVLAADLGTSIKLDHAVVKWSLSVLYTDFVDGLEAVWNTSCSSLVNSCIWSNSSGLCSGIELFLVPASAPRLV